MNAFKEKFRIDELSIQEFKYWIVSLRPKQPTLGSLILSLKRECSSLGELTTTESLEMGEVFKYIENILNKSFKPDKINYLVLMMIDHQVHFHIIPRYKNYRIFNNITFVDKCWPKPPNILLDNSEELDLTKLLTELKK